MVLSTLFSSNTDDLVITQASPMTSFDWSDFPLVHQFNPDDETGDFGLDGNASSSAAPSLDLQHTSKKSKLYDYNTLYTSSITPSLCSSVSSITSSSSSDSSCCTSSSNDRRVSFAPRVEVREYSLVLGDNLLCDTLPLSLGWAYSECIYKGYTSPNTRRHGNQLKLTYGERRNLLKRVGGYSEEDLSQRVNSLHHVVTTAQLLVQSDV